MQVSTVATEVSWRGMGSRQLPQRHTRAIWGPDEYNAPTLVQHNPLTKYLDYEVHQEGNHKMIVDALYTIREHWCSEKHERQFPVSIASVTCCGPQRQHM
jgi:hypothetical protein